MTLPASGAISLSDVMAELKIANPARALPISLGHADVLALAGVAGPANSLSNLYGKSAAAALTVTAANDGPKFKATTGIGPAPTINATSTPAGGSGSYSYAWTRVSGDAGITCNAPSAQNPTFSRANCANGSDYIATWRVTVTDTANSNTATATTDIEQGGYQF